MSKIKTAPWVGLPGEFEPGAQRWCFYDCNVLGDPALKVWIDNPSVGIGSTAWQQNVLLSPNPANESVSLFFDLPGTTTAGISLYNAIGQELIHWPTREFPSGKNSITLNTSDLPAGIYFVRIEAQVFSTVKKLMIK
jgi:hypothetical protein